MSSTDLERENFNSPGFVESIFRKVQKIDLNLVEQLLRTHENEHAQLRMGLEKSNRMTRRSFWKKWVEFGDRHAWPLVDENWIFLDPLTKWQLLDRALHDGLGEQAIRLINNGAPMNSISDRGLHIQGPAAKLMGNDYENIDRATSTALARAMFENGAVAMMNPGSIVYSENVKLFLEYAPDPKDKNAWKETMMWGAEDVLDEGGSVLVYEVEAENALLFMRAGYPCDHVDFLARACFEGRNDIAELLLCWEGFDVGDPNREAESWEAGLEPIAPKAFWHALTSRWGRKKEMTQQQNIVENDSWPSFEVCKKLLDCSWADPGALDTKGRTAVEHAQQDFGHLGVSPMETTLSRWKREALLDISKRRGGMKSDGPRSLM